MRPGYDLKLSIVEWDEERGFRVVLSGSTPDGSVVMSEARKVEYFDQAVRSAVELLAEFQRRVG